MASALPHLFDQVSTGGLEARRGRSTRMPIVNGQDELDSDWFLWGA